MKRPKLKSSRSVRKCSAAPARRCRALFRMWKRSGSAIDLIITEGMPDENSWRELNREINKFNAAREHAKLRYYYLIVTREAMGFRRHASVEEAYRIPPRKKVDVEEGMDRYKRQRIRMVDSQIRSRGITDERVIKAIEKVPRHLFVDEALWDQSYNDSPLPIGENQTISQPYMVALMTEALQLKGPEKVLEIGTGPVIRPPSWPSLPTRSFPSSGSPFSPPGPGKSSTP